MKNIGIIQIGFYRRQRIISMLRIFGQATSCRQRFLDCANQADGWEADEAGARSTKRTTKKRDSAWKAPSRFFNLSI